MPRQASIPGTDLPSLWKKDQKLPTTASTPKPLAIKWAFAKPPLEPSSWHLWEQSSIGSGTDDDQTLETALSWEPGTIAILRAAFAHNLTRRTGFVGAASLPKSAQNALRQAAEVFRRGVGFKESPAQPSEISVEKSGSYQIQFGSGHEQGLTLLDREAFTVLDGNVARHWPDCKELCKNHVLLTLTEHEKSLVNVAAILTAWKQHGRNASWQVLGGGILADTAMFAASLVNAAVTLIPTTLLSMADACVGGKTGVNFPPFGKNQLGTFYFPKAVKIWTTWLNSLPARELRAGAAECLKHAFLSGDFELATLVAHAVAQKDLDQLAYAMPQIVQFKSAIVARDPVEAGERAILNFGHTLGHALEGLSQENTKGDLTLLHGEAVGIGLSFALALSVRVAGLAPTEERKMQSTLRLAGCLMTSTELTKKLGVRDLRSIDTLGRLQTFIGLDKKNTGAAATSDWILLASPGKLARGPKGEWTVPVTWEDIKGTWGAFLK